MRDHSLCPPISVIICTRNRPGDLELCLPTVLRCDYREFEVIIIDQSDNDMTEAVVRAFQNPQTEICYCHTETVGKSRALNLGLQVARHGLIAFTDDDCETPEEWLHSIADAFDQDPTIDIAFGPVVPSPALGDLTDKVVPWWDFDKARPIAQYEVCGMGANMALRRCVLDRLPEGDIYDVCLGPGASFPAAEEGDMSYRLRTLGANAVLRPTMRLYHRAYRTPGQWHKVLFGYGMGDAAFWLKHARCGDLWAVWVVAKEMTWKAILEFCKLIALRANKTAYVRGFWKGVLLSFGVPVDVTARLYRVTSEKPAR